VRVVPAVLERAVTAGALLIPFAAVLFMVGLEGDAGRLGVTIALLGAAVYALVTWLLGDRRRLTTEAGHAEVAPTDAAIEPLGRTAARALVPLAVVVAVCVALALLDALLFGLLLTGGYGGSVALGGLTLRRAERRDAGRLVRAPDGRLLRF
jgi:hypothetical protein